MNGKERDRNKLPNVPDTYLTTAALTRFTDRAGAGAASIELLDIASGTNATARGIRALLHCWRAAHMNAAQQLPDGNWYVETCPAYIATVQGMTRWASRVAWAAAKRILGWVEISAAQARQMGARLRTLPHGKRRGGRHLILQPWQMQALQGACQRLSAPTRQRSAPILVSPRRSALQRLQARQGRCVAIRCPQHRDRRPSLVLWMNGGGLCMSCGWRVSWAADGQRVKLHAAMSQRPPDLPAPTYAATTNSPHMIGGGRSAPVGPVGGMVATRSTASIYIGATLKSWQDRHGDWHLSRSQGHRLSGCPLQALETADRRSLGPAATERAMIVQMCGAGLPSRALLPDRLLSVSCMGKRSRADQWRARLQRWVLFDLDDVCGLEKCGADLGSALAQVALRDSEASGSVAVVRTGPNGLQIWLKLAHPRHSPEIWHQLPEVREWHQHLGGQLLKAVRRLGASGGSSDDSACAAGRFGRRPGWRMLPNGTAYRSHLLEVVCA